VASQDFSTSEPTRAVLHPVGSSRARREDRARCA
jgi:hypothetical protein